MPTPSNPLSVFFNNNGQATIYNATASTSTTTGALTVYGGLGVGTNLYTNLATVTNASSATSTTTGALTVAGGMGVGGNVYVSGSTPGDGGSNNGTGSLVYIRQNTTWSGQQPWALYVSGYSYLNGFRINGGDGVRALFLASGTIGFATGDTSSPITFTTQNDKERVRIDTTGTVYIGTTTQYNNALLNVMGGVYAASSATISLVNTSVNNYGSHLSFANTQSSGQTSIGFNFSGTPKASIRVDGNGNFVLNAGSNNLYYNADLGTSSAPFQFLYNSIVYQQVLGTTSTFLGNIIVNTTTNSISTNTGALQIAGGIGVNGQIYAGSSATISVNASVTNNYGSHITLANPTGTQTGIGWTFGGTTKASIRVDNSGNFIINANSNNIYFNNDLGTSASPLQFLFSNNLYQQVLGTTSTFLGNLIANSGTNATSTNTGALQVRGGLGVGGAIYAGQGVNAVGTSSFRSTVTFVSSDLSATIVARMLTSDVLTFSGARGQLFSISDSFTGTIFGVYDISGVPAIEAYDTGNVVLTETFGNVGIGVVTSSTTAKLTVGGGVSIAGITTITNTSTSLSTGSGALQVQGGAGIWGNLYVGGTLNAASVVGSISTATYANNINITNDTTSVGLQYLTFVAASSGYNSLKTAATSGISYYPNSGNLGIGTNNPGNRLTVYTTATNTDGLILGSSVGGGNVSLRPNNSQGANNGITQAGDAGIIYSSAAGQNSGGFVIAPWYSGTSGMRFDSSGTVTIPLAQDATTTATGGLRVAGGVGIGGTLYANNATVSNQTNSTSSTTGALIVSGGVGIGGDLWIGGNEYIQKTNITASADSIAALTYTTAFASTVSNTDIFFKPDGTKMFGVSSSGVYSWSLGTAWSITGTITTSTSLSLAAVDTTPNGLTFSPDGSKMVVVGNTAVANATFGILANEDRAYYFTLSVPWDVSSATLSGSIRFATGLQGYSGTAESIPTACTFDSTGSYFYMIGTTVRRVFQYSLSTPYTVTTATSTYTNGIVLLEDTQPNGMSFNYAGTRMYVTGQVSDFIYEYRLSTPWDVTTAVFYDKYFVGIQNGTMTGLYVNDTATNNIFLTGSTGIYQYQKGTQATFINPETTASGIILSGNVRIKGSINPLVIDSNAYVFGSAGIVLYQNVISAGQSGVTGNIFNGISTGGLSMYNAQSSGAFLLGGNAATGSITVGQSTGTQTLNLGTGASGLTTTVKTVNIGTNGLAGSNSNINIGSTVTGAFGLLTIGGTQTNITSTITSVSTTTGALVVTGGIGVGGNLYAGGNVVAYGSNSLFGDLASSSTFNVNAIRSLNLIGTAAVMRIARASAGGDPAVELLNLNTTTGAITTWWDLYSNVSDNLSIRRRGASGANADLFANFTLNGTTFGVVPVTISTWTNATSTTTGALIVTGGVGIGGTLYTTNQVVSGTTNSTTTNTGALQVVGGVAVGGNLAIGGYTYYNNLKSAHIYIKGTGLNNNGNNAVYLNGAPVNFTLNQRGLTFVTIDKATLTATNYGSYDTYGTATSSTQLATLLDAMTNTQFGVLLSFDAIEAQINSTLISALARKGLYKLAYGDHTGSRRPYVALFDATGGANPSRNVMEVWESSSANAPQAIISTYLTTDGSPQGAGFQGNDLTNVLISGQPDTATPVVIVDQGGGVTINGVTTVTNNTQASSTVSGALQVIGGVGIGGNLWVGGTINATIVGITSTATNIAGGTTGQIPYQTSPGVTSFYGPGTAGQVHVSGGAAAPIYQSTLSLTTLALGTGVNATAPNSLLDMHRAFAAYGIYEASTATFSTDNGSTAWVVGQITGYVAAGPLQGIGNFPGGLAFKTKATDGVPGTVPVTNMVLNAAGNLGIGITDPLSKLHVAGDARVSGVFTSTNATQSNSTITGALILAGGIGVGGNVNINGSLNAITKSFVISHPTKPGMRLRYGSLEGPENGVYIRGRLKGSTTIQLPDYWTKLVDPESITVQITPIGKHQKLYVEAIKDNTVIIENDAMFGGSIDCYYVVFAERADTNKLEVEMPE